MSEREIRVLWGIITLLAIATIAVMLGFGHDRPRPVPFPTVRPTNDIAPSWMPKYPGNSAIPQPVPLTPVPGGAIFPSGTNRPMALARYGYGCHCPPANAATASPVERHMDGGVLSTRGP